MAFSHNCGAALEARDDVVCGRCGTRVRSATGGDTIAYQGVGIRFVAQFARARDNQIPRDRAHVYRG